MGMYHSLFNYFPGAAAASRVYVDALSKLALQAQLGTWGGSKDVGKSRYFLITASRRGDLLLVIVLPIEAFPSIDSHLAIINL